VSPNVPKICDSNTTLFIFPATELSQPLEFPYLTIYLRLISSTCTSQERTIMAHTVRATLIESLFAPYGGVISAGLKIPKTASNPSTTKSFEVVKHVDLYSQAPSKQPGRPVIHVEVVNPKALQTESDGVRTLCLTGWSATLSRRRCLFR
jgi:hypothetical protein